MEINITFELPFSVSDVYTAWVSSETVIPPATYMDVLPKVGGHYRLVMENPGQTMVNEGVFSVVEPEQRVVYTWEWNGDGEVTTIDVRFSAVAVGTRVDLSHTGFEKAESVQMHEMGWDSYVAGLTSFLEKKSQFPE